ncbi:hypothetical protein O6H91_16G095100 [Diphasiastrum complanatum]|uniref:Uncharacterized protein n=1 Tax=Diphasiastrum complanatum TaxID=34168 RepID=A0ACC2BEV8_DIPCM|nr:hypothetical protein O6H91_16G095100 [Diphasiastrum complanatum]
MEEEEKGWKGLLKNKELRSMGSVDWSANTTSCPQPSHKPPFRVVPDDTKPIFRDPLSKADPIETEQILLQPPPLKPPHSSSSS